VFPYIVFDGNSMFTNIIIDIVLMFRYCLAFSAHRSLFHTSIPPFRTLRRECLVGISGNNYFCRTVQLMLNSKKAFQNEKDYVFDGGNALLHLGFGAVYSV